MNSWKSNLFAKNSKLFKRILNQNHYQFTIHNSMNGENYIFLFITKNFIKIYPMIIWVAAFYAICMQYCHSFRQQPSSFLLLLSLSLSLSQSLLFSYMILMKWSQGLWQQIRFYLFMRCSQLFERLSPFIIFSFVQ